MGIEPTSEAWALVTTNLVNSDRRFKWTVSELSLNSFQFGAFPGVTAQWWVLSKSNEINPFATTYSWMHLRARMLISIRNRQVVGSTPTLGSNLLREREIFEPQPESLYLGGYFVLYLPPNVPFDVVETAFPS